MRSLHSCSLENHPSSWLSINTSDRKEPGVGPGAKLEQLTTAFLALLRVRGLPGLCHTS